MEAQSERLARGQPEPWVAKNTYCYQPADSDPEGSRGTVRTPSADDSDSESACS